MGRRVHDWEEIQRFHDEGHGFVECAESLGFRIPPGMKAIRRGRLEPSATPFQDRRRRYDWAEMQAYYEEGHTYRECRVEFGFCAAAWDKARKRGEIKARPLAVPLEVLLGAEGADMP